MDLKIKYINSNVPLWCQDLDDENLKVVWQNNGAYYAIDAKSSFPLKKGFFNNSEHVFRFKYLSSKGAIFYFFAVARKVPRVNPNTLNQEMVPGIEILKCVTIRDDTLCEHNWQDDFLPFQSEEDPMYKVAESAKRNESKSPPMYLNFVDL